jgi:hypothetical protein
MSETMTEFGLGFLGMIRCICGNVELDQHLSELKRLPESLCFERLHCFSIALPARNLPLERTGMSENR